MGTPSPSPHRQSSKPFPGPSSPRLHRNNVPSYLNTISAQPQAQYPQPSVILGFSPPNSANPLPTLPEASSLHTDQPRPSPLHLNSGPFNLAARLSPQLTTPIEQTFGFNTPQQQNSPSGPYQTSQYTSSPRHELPPRSRRNSAAIVSISLSSRSRSRTPRGNAQALPNAGSGQGTPSKGSNSVTPKGEDGGLQLSGGNEDGIAGWGVRGREEEVDDWVPAGGMLLDDGDEAAVVDELEEFEEDEDEGDEGGRVWTGISEISRVVEDVLRPGMVFGEGREFQGEVVELAVGVWGDEDVGLLPLRRGGSEAGQRDRKGVVGVEGKKGGEKKAYEVVRQLGSGSYAVVYLVREKGGRKREYALKCLSKQDLAEEQLETQLFEATIHLSLPIHQNIVTLHQTLQTKKWLFLMLELCPGEDLFFWLEKSRDASPPPVNAHLPSERSIPMSSSKFSSSSIPFSSSQLFSNMAAHTPGSYSSSPHGFSGSPASLLFSHAHGHATHTPQSFHHHPHHPHSSFAPSQTPPTPSLLSAFSANTLLSQRRLRLIASMFAQMCEAVAVCHDSGISHRDIKPENFICCDSIELETTSEEMFGDGYGEEEKEEKMDFGPQAKRKVVVKLTDFGLATTEEESGDVECGSKPYMSYECRNNLGPTYLPAPADVWSLGIVLINMLFHRNPWKDPIPGDINFDNFFRDPIGFLLAKFNGIGREVATYLGEHVLCTDVADRVSAREFGRWIKGLPEMIGGRKAVALLKMARLEGKSGSGLQFGGSGGGGGKDKELFVKSPVVDSQVRKNSASALSALTSSAPLAAGLSTFPPPVRASRVIVKETVVDTRYEVDGEEEEEVEERRDKTPELDHDHEDGEMQSATTIDEQPTPTDSSEVTSPDTTLIGDVEDGTASRDESESRSLSTHKRRKRGARKGKAAQAALASMVDPTGKPTKEERDALLAELASASQSLARDLSKTSKNEIDLGREEDFPPLGMTAAQIAAEKKSKWKDMMKMSSGNPEIAALARRVAERDAGSGGNWSAPAKMQHPSGNLGLAGVGTGAVKPRLKQTATTVTASSSAGMSSGLSSFGGVSSSTSEQLDVVGEASMEGREEQEELEWRRKEKDEEMRGRGLKAKIAAQAIAGFGSEPMGSFGKGVSGLSGLGGPKIGKSQQVKRNIRDQLLDEPPHQPQPQHQTQHQAQYSEPPSSWYPPNVSSNNGYMPARPNVPVHNNIQSRPIVKSGWSGHTIRPEPSTQQQIPNTTNQSRSIGSASSLSTLGSTSTVLPTSVGSTRSGVMPVNIPVSGGGAAGGGGGGGGGGGSVGETISPNKPKLKGQIQSLAKMLSGLKTKSGRE